MNSTAFGDRVLRFLTTLLLAVAAQPALATINCEIQPTGPTSLTAFTGETLTVDYTIGGGGCSETTTTVATLLDSTGSSASPPTATGLETTRTVTANIGANAGVFTFRVTCTSGCFGSPSRTEIDYVVNVSVPVSLNLNAQGPTSFTAFAGEATVITVRADDSGTPAGGVTIEWSGSGPVSGLAPTTVTNAAGFSSQTATWGPGTGTVLLSVARLDNTDFPVNYTINVVPPPVRTLVPISGSGQTGPTNAPLANPLVVEARDDGSPAAGTGITWSVRSGDATIASADASTNAAGRAQAQVSFGANPGPVVVRAARVDQPSVFTDFSLTSTLVRSVAIISGDGQSAPTRTTVPAPLVIEARDNSVPAAGIGITWTVVSGDATLVGASSPTDNAGRAQASVLLGATPGTVVIQAARNDEAGVVGRFTLTSTLVRSLMSVSGNGQSAPTRTAITNPLVIEARDNDQAAAGVGIVWSVVSGDATLASSTSPTDGNGRAQTGVQFGATPGVVVVRAARLDDPGATVDFSLTSTFTRTIAIVSGANQQGLPGLPLPNPIVIEVRGNGQPESGVAVDITVQGDATVSGDDRGESAKIVKLTGADGRVSATVTLGAGSSGLVNIQASVPSSPGVSTSVAATASNLADVPGLPDPLREFGGVIQQACGAIAQIAPAQRTPEQVDLLARCQSFAGADPGQIADALQELLPDTSLAMVTVALQAGQAQLDNIKARIAALRSGTQGSKFGGLAIASPTGAIPVTGLVDAFLGASDTTEAGAEFDRWGYFVSGTLGRGEAEAGRLSPAYDFDINGLTAGLDYRFSDHLVAGASVGYTKQDTELSGGEGNVDATGYSLSAYATFYRDQSWYSDAVLTWGRNDYDTLRRIRYTLTGPGGTSTIDQSARGRLDGDLLSLAATLGRDYQAGGWSIGPYGRLLYSRIDFDAGRELIGGGAGSGLALEIFPGVHTSFASVAGAKFSKAISRDWGILMPHFQVEWEHEYRDDPQRVGARFLADPNATRFTIEGDPIDSSFFRIGGGLSVLFAGGRSGFLYVERVVGKDGFDQTNVALGIRGEF